MLKNYVLIALRRIAREKIYVFINLSSLALGIASFVLLAMYLRSELTYDQHHVNHERIYRIVARFGGAGQEPRNFAISQIGIGPLLTKEFPQLGISARFMRQDPSILKYGDRQRVWEDTYFADPTVFEVFTHDVIYGDPSTALRTPNSIAVSESFARFYFGDDNPIGKVITSGALAFPVTLVFRDLPENSHLKYSLLYSMGLRQAFDPNFLDSYERSLWNVEAYTYLLVPNGFASEEFPPLFSDFFDRHMKQQSLESNLTFRADLQPMTSIHFGERLKDDRPVGNIFYVYGFASVAFFVLFVACINYVNLATARAAKRSKEVGMRQVLGATRMGLIAQFLGESIVLTLIATALGILVVLAVVYLSPMGEIMGKNDLAHYFGKYGFWASTLLLSLVVALLAGLYPAIHLSGIPPIAALTHTRRSWKAGLNIRQVLVFIQLTISIGAIGCVMLMMAQMRYVRDKPLGFDKDNRVIVKLIGYDIATRLATLKGEIRNLPGVVDVTTIGAVPGVKHSTNTIRTETNTGEFEGRSTDRIRVGLNFMRAMNVEIVRGRGFSEDTPSDVSQSVLVNESFVKNAGWDEPIGKGFRMGRDRVARVVGVVKDFHYASLYSAIGPLLIEAVDDTVKDVPDLRKPSFSASMIVVVDRKESLGNTMKSIGELVSKLDPNYEFEPQLLDARLSVLYRSESDLMRLTGVFAVVCILLSLIGLIGIALFSTELRTKEIGIRRVLGASEAGIAMLMSKGPLILSVLAAIPATICGYYAIGRWTQRFAYRADLDWSVFVISTFIVASVALLAVASQSLIAARNDPIRSLRYE